MADAPIVIVDAVPHVLVAEQQQVASVVVASGGQGPPGPPGIGGADVSKYPNNQLEHRPDGLYVQPLRWETAEW